MENNDLSLRNAAKRIGVAKETLRLWVLKGKGPECKRVNKGQRMVYRFNVDELDRWMRENEPKRSDSEASIA